MKILPAMPPSSPFADVYRNEFLSVIGRPSIAGLDVPGGHAKLKQGARTLAQYVESKSR